MIQDPAVPVEPWQSRVEYRIVITITPAGALVAGPDFRSDSTLSVYVASDGEVVVDRVGLSRVDGPGVAYGGAGDSVAIARAMMDCGEGECSHEFRAWAEVSTTMAGPGLLRVFSYVDVSFTDPEVRCEVDLGWLQTEAERITELSDASVPPPDAGAGP